MVEVLRQGLYTSIQDLGRIGYRRFGVPISGVMDTESSSYGNKLLANPSNCAVMEMTLQGPLLRFLTATRIAITGAPLIPTLNDAAIAMNKSLSINRGDMLDLGNTRNGARSYLAIAGGFQTPTILNSRSFYKGITDQSIIRKGDKIAFHSSFKIGKNIISYSKNNNFCLESNDVEALKGPEFSLLNESQIQKLTESNFVIGINNRMAYQLQQPLENDLASIISSATLPGTVQLTPSGKIIILMKDCQTTGGYPRILQLSERGISTLAQKSQYEVIRFEIISELVIE